MGTARAFLAVPLPVSLQASIATLQEELTGALPGIRWTRADTVHLTLHFFAAANTDDLEKIRASMLSVSFRERAFQVDVLGLGAFPDHRRPRVVWLGLAPEEPLRALQRGCGEELVRNGIPVEPRAFVPHLTIGRFREHGPDLAALPAAPAASGVGRLPVDHLVLFESRLHQGGAQHFPLFTVPLKRNDLLNDRTTEEGTKDG